jgi:tetratricopeptide (TPR) repeat protein
VRSGPKLAFFAPVLLTALAWAQAAPASQKTDPGAAQSSGTQTSTAQQNSGASDKAQPQLAPAIRSGPNVAPENERPIEKKRRTGRSMPAADCVGAVNTTDCLSSPAPPKIPDASSQDAKGGSGGGLLQNLPPPRSGEEGVSSSRDTEGNLGGLVPGDDVNELHPFNPHQAAKDIEVGEFYLKRGNYKAAISRFQSALQNKPNDAVATYRLAQALEKDKQLPAATKYYSLYLDIVPTGEYAADAKAALDRLEHDQQASVPAK